MTALSIQPPFPIITDIDGQPLEDGYIWIGTAGLNPIGNPISVYWDAALSVPAALPVRTRGGYPMRSGTPARLYVDSDYSLLVQNKNGSTVYSALTATERLSGVVVEVDATDVAFLQAGTGAVTRTAQAKMRDVVSVKDFGAVGDGVTNDTAAIQAAINTGLDIVFPAGNYRASGLTQSTNLQRFSALGHVNISKNNNGVLFTSSGNYVQLEGIQFVGTGFTGDNVNMSGQGARLLNCASYGTPGRAVKITGNQPQIWGTCNVYATTDATANGYDIEIGSSGTATLYAQLFGIYTSQPTGGILLTDTGSHWIMGGQFGKLTIQSGTSPAGVNGGMTHGSRILGNVSVGLSNSVFSGNQFSTVTITFVAGTSQHSLDLSNFTVGTTIVNNGNVNSVIMRAPGTGASGALEIGFGPSSWSGTWRYYSNGDAYAANNLFLDSGKFLRQLDSGGADRILIGMDASDNLFLGANVSSKFSLLSSGTGGVYQSVGGANITRATSAAFNPGANNTFSLGAAGVRWSEVFAVNGTINTSDEREKTSVEVLSDAERRVALTCKGLVRKFQFRDAVQKKGLNNARVHVGVMAQDVLRAFEAENLDPMRYGIVCFDSWEAEAEVTDDDGNVIAPARRAGNSYGIRYEQLLAFIIAAL